jgi:hypothetical protein
VCAHCKRSEVVARGRAERDSKCKQELIVATIDKRRMIYAARDHR